MAGNSISEVKLDFAADLCGITESSSEVRVAWVIKARL